MLSGDVRQIDGTDNNPFHDDWGAAGIQLLRVGPAAYGDLISSPGGVGRPSARKISNTVSADPLAETLNDRSMSAFMYAWGQFIDHDLDLTGAESPAQPFNISVPTGDPYFDPAGSGTQKIRLNRSEYDPATGTSKFNPRQQLNDITAWLDGSVVYGSDNKRAAALRTFSGGRLKTSAGNFMPYNTAGLPNANDAHLFPDNQLFLGGDVRANENVELTAIHTLFLREHNRVAAAVAKASPWMSDERLYQAARGVVVAEIESITYNQWLPTLLGAGAIDPYSGYNARVNPGIATEFSTAAYRVGHSMLGNDVEFLDDTGAEVREELELAGAFFNPPVVKETGIDPILKYLASDPAQEVDTKIVDGVRNFLFGPPGADGFDLAALNIQRGRDHGLSDYNTARAAYGLPRVSSFSQITSDPALQQQLKSLYGSVNNIDMWVGGLAENHARGASVGPLIRAVLVDQFERVRDGDRFWYERTFNGSQLDSLRNTTLADVIKRNTGLVNLQDNVFVFDVTIRGRVLDASAATVVGLGGWTVQLQDADGTVLGTAVTAADGSYRFSGLGLGTYRVREVVQLGWVQKRADPADIEAVQGDKFTGVNFRNVRSVVTAASATVAPALAFGTARVGVDDVLSDSGDATVLA
jgi:peroxidase